MDLKHYTGKSFSSVHISDMHAIRMYSNTGYYSIHYYYDAIILMYVCLNIEVSSIIINYAQVKINVYSFKFSSVSSVLFCSFILSTVILETHFLASQIIKTTNNPIFYIQKVTQIAFSHYNFDMN